MSELIVSEFISLDGVFEAPGPDGSGFIYEGWTMPYGSEEFMQFKLNELLASDAQLLGRVTYEGFAKAWPGREDPMGFSDKFNSMPKYVVSTSLKSTQWNNSHIIGDNFVEKIKQLKARNGENILVSGSGKLVRFLLKHKLVDQLNLLVYPVILGTGKRLFTDVQKTELQLVNSKTFAKGVVHLAYSLKDSPHTGK